MIANERQYRNTKSWVRKFNRELGRVERRQKKETDPEQMRTKLYADGLRGMLEDLQTQMKEYEERQKGAAS
jgi:hypothetical protein